MGTTGTIGLWLARRIRQPLISLASSATALADGEVLPELEVPRSDDEC